MHGRDLMTDGRADSRIEEVAQRAVVPIAIPFRNEIVGAFADGLVGRPAE